MESSYILDPEALRRFEQLRHAAVDAVTDRFYATHAGIFERFGERGRRACREDIEYQLDFLRPALEFGVLAPYVEYQRWFAEVLAARQIPTAHIAESLEWLGEFFLDQMPGSEGEIISAALRATAAEALAETPGAAADSEAAPAVWAQQDEFTAALLSGERRRAQTIVTELLASGHTLIDIYVHLIQPTLYAIGMEWLHNRVSVAQEHLATATATTVMAEAFAQAPLPPVSGRKALFACIEGNNHAVGLRMVSDAFELAGWDVQYLGANTPTRALIEQTLAWQPNLVGLSITFPYQIRGARDAIAELRTRLGENCPRILVGGGVLNRFPGLARHLHADIHASNALDAVAQANRGNAT
jgi:methanogenic corrinoid protein MtbC1